MLRANALSSAVHRGASDGRRPPARHHGEGRHRRPAANRQWLRHAGDALLRRAVAHPPLQSAGLPRHSKPTQELVCPGVTYLCFFQGLACGGWPGQHGI